MSLTWKEWRKIWIKVDIYPLIAATGLGVAAVGYFGTSKLRADPQMAWSKSVRLGGHDAMYSRPNADRQKSSLAYKAQTWSPVIFGAAGNPILENKRAKLEVPVPEEPVAISEAVEEAADDVAEVASEKVEAASENLEAASDVASDAIDSASETGADAVQEVAEGVDQAAEVAAEAASEALEVVMPVVEAAVEATAGDPDTASK